MKQFYLKYKHAIPLVIYALIYITWFLALEKRNISNYTIIHMKIDDYIPFCEFFIIPYFLWFAYVSAVVLYLFFTDKRDYHKVCLFLFTGMTIFLIVSTFFPNGQHLRPVFFPRDNVLTQLVRFLYRADTPTNVFPSIHVYNSIGAHIAIAKSSRLNNRKGIQLGSFILSLSIILSTVFLKQHSMFDVITACIMAVIIYAVVYVIDYTSIASTAYHKRQNLES